MIDFFTIHLLVSSLASIIVEVVVAGLLESGWACLNSSRSFTYKQGIV